MSDLSRMRTVRPIIKYPHEAQTGKTYLMTIDLQAEEGFEWQYEREEYPIYCTVDSNLFSSKPIGEPVIVLHRFGGSYGEAQFLLTAASKSGQGNIKVNLFNAWGVSVKALDLEQIYLVSRDLIHLESDLTIEREVIVTNTVATTSEKAVNGVLKIEEQKQKNTEIATAYALILTGLSIEYLSVRAHLTDLREEVHPQGTVYERGKFVGNERVWEVGIAQVGVGNVRASVEAERAIAHFKPDILLSIGIAGGIKDVEIGDVVVATKVYRYKSKDVRNLVFARPTLGQFAFSARPALNQADYALVQRARSEAKRGEWLQRLSTSLTLQPHVLVAPIAVGEKVFASKKSDVSDFIRENLSDVVAVEVGGASFLEDIHIKHRVPMMLVRGICDLIDNKIEIDQTGYQEIASRHASAFAFEVLANFQRDRKSDSGVTSKSIATRFDKFILNIQPSKRDVAEVNLQVDYIVEQLQNIVASRDDFGIEKVLKAGSYARYTALRKVGNNGSDVDIVTYFTGTRAKKIYFGELKGFICKILRDFYSSKSQVSIDNLRGNVRIKFNNRLTIDVVPVIKDDIQGVSNGGWFPYAYGSRHANSWQLTSVTCHSQFIIRRTAKSKEMSEFVSFNKLVRLVKWWNNRQKQLRQPSILCELITAAAFDVYGVTNEWQSSLRQVFSFILEHQFLEPIVFDDYYDTNGLDLPSDQVIILDPANPRNNFARNWTERTRLAYLDRVQEAYDSMIEAQIYELDGDIENVVKMWCRVFGNSFRSLSEKN